MSRSRPGPPPEWGGTASFGFPAPRPGSFVRAPRPAGRRAPRPCCSGSRPPPKVGRVPVLLWISGPPACRPFDFQAPRPFRHVYRLAGRLAARLALFIKFFPAPRRPAPEDVILGAGPGPTRGDAPASPGTSPAGSATRTSGNPTAPTARLESRRPCGPPEPGRCSGSGPPGTTGTGGRGRSS